MSEKTIIRVDWIDDINSGEFMVHVDADASPDLLRLGALLAAHKVVETLIEHYKEDAPGNPNNKPKGD